MMKSLSGDHMDIDVVDYKGACALVALIGIHVLAAMYDGDLLTATVGADIALISAFFGFTIAPRGPTPPAE